MRYGHVEGSPFDNDIEVMPESDHQHVPHRRRLTPSGGAFQFPDLAILMLVLLGMLFLPGLVPTASAQSDGNSEQPEKADPNSYDIAFIIDNRDIAGSPPAKDDVDALTDMLDRHMFADHIVRLERPSFALICDIFGGCPNEADQPWPSLISQIADPSRSRLYVYYLGPGRIEGQERQLLFEDGAGRTSPYAVGWLHRQLEKTNPKSALVMMDTSFSPRPMPCASENPTLIDETMKTVQRNYGRLMEGRSLPRGLAELTSTMPGEAPHCDRYELTSDEIERPLFTKFVLKGVVEGLADKEPFGDEDGTVELGELAAYTRDKIRRAVQFQWGRRQTVWRIGPGGRAIARVKPRAPTWKEKKKSETPKPETREEPSEKKAEVKPDPKPEPETPKPTAKKDIDRPEERHVCDVNQEGEACIAFCADNPDDFRCPFLGVSICEGEPISDACPCAQNDPRSGCSGGGSWCRWSADYLGGTAETVVNTFGGDPVQACQWATKDEDNLEDSVVWDLLGPIGWRLIRPAVRPRVACMLNCQGRAEPGAATIDEDEALETDTGQTANLTQDATVAGDQPSEWIEPSPKTAFEEEVCDETLPPYIALPRWMPGTLMISETLRFFSGCGPPEGPPRFVRGMPPPVLLVEAPPITISVRYKAPSPFAMPPPISLPPAKPVAIIAPVFKPTANQVRWLQSALIMDNHDPGPIDGVIGGKTNAAIRSWREENGKTPSDEPLTEIEFNRIIRLLGKKFDQLTPGAPRY